MLKNIWMFSMAIVLLTDVAVVGDLDNHPQTNVCQDWRLGVQTWSFNRFKLFEAIEKTRSLGLDYIQAYPGQVVSDEINAKFNESLTSKQRRAVKKKLEDAGISIYAFGVTKIPSEEFRVRNLFEFAREMGIETLVSEPTEDQFDLIDELCQEYKVKLAIHNHPKPSHYWNPDKVLEMCEGRSKWIGACADVGHWVRSGLNPVDCLKKLEGRIHDVHIKEIDNGHDVIWGTGKGRIKNILEELYRQGYQGTFSIEYEYNWDNNIPEIRQSVAYFNSVASELNPTGWKPLFNYDLSNATLKEDSWVFKEGELIRKGGGDIWTQAQYSDFVLDFEFKLEEGTNSGVFLRAADHNWLPWIEVQIEDSYDEPISKYICGGIFDIIEPATNAVKPIGQWNRMTIMARNSYISVILNNELVVDINLKDWKEAHKNPDGSKNKFNVAYKDLPSEGFIGFQDHGQHIWYRNIKIKEL